MVFISSLSFAQEQAKSENSGTPKKFNAGKTIIEHVTDAHEWHIMELGEKPVAFPLPIIIYSSDKGLEMFSSSRFEHGTADYNGYRLVGQKISVVGADGKVDDAATAKLIDFSITKNVASILLVMSILLYVFISVANSYKKNPGGTPKGMQALVEPLIIFIRDDVAKASIGKKYKKFMPYLLTVFFFILVTNLLGLIPILPGGANVTGNIAVTLTLAVFTFIITTINGNKHYWGHIIAMPGVPKWVLFLLTPIEIIGIFLKPFVLTIRLFANIAAGHIIALSFFSLIFIFGEMNTGLGFGTSIVSVLFTVFMLVLDLLVAFLQAYVFTLLSAIYFGAAVEDGHGEHHEDPAGHPAHVDQNQQLLT